MKIIDKILSRNEFRDNPPILLDIGASGELHAKWKDIAKYSICIAFDADDRDLLFAEKETDNYKKLYIFNRIVSDQSDEELEFHLTNSPYCSSVLPPANKSLNNWIFSELFNVERKAKIKAVNLPAVLRELNIKKIDWFKTDSQGTDLRLFKSLGQDIVDKVLIAEFEPGIIDAYEGEDKLASLMLYMDKQPFWMSEINILGSKRINSKIYDKLNKQERKTMSFLKTSPGWGEVLYLNSFEKDSLLDKRDYLLGWVFAYNEGQYGFALEIALKGLEKFNDDIFAQMKECSLKKLELIYLKNGKKKRYPLYLIKKFLYSRFLD